jgi:hypothetical protein
MVKTQVYLGKEELAALQEAARKSGKSVSELVREAIRRTRLRAEAVGPWRSGMGRSPAARWNMTPSTTCNQCVTERASAWTRSLG